MTDNTISVTEADRDFSRVMKLVDEQGTAIILKNNVPRYIVTAFPQTEKLQYAADEDIEAISELLIEKNAEAYKELAK